MSKVKTQKTLTRCSVCGRCHEEDELRRRGGVNLTCLKTRLNRTVAQFNDKVKFSSTGNKSRTKNLGYFQKIKIPHTADSVWLLFQWKHSTGMKSLWTLIYLQISDNWVLLLSSESNSRTLKHNWRSEIGMFHCRNAEVQSNGSEE